MLHNPSLPLPPPVPPEPKVQLSFVTFYQWYHPAGQAILSPTHCAILAPPVVPQSLCEQQSVRAGCADTIDIGEQSYSMVLADDLDNNGRLDLLVSTMNGNVYALETSSVYHPMKAWTSVVRST